MSRPSPVHAVPPLDNGQADTPASPEAQKAPPGMDPGLRLARRLDKLMAEGTEEDRALALAFLVHKYGRLRIVFQPVTPTCNAPPLG